MTGRIRRHARNVRRPGARPTARALDVNVSEDLCPRRRRRKVGRWVVALILAVVGLGVLAAMGSSLVRRWFLENPDYTVAEVDVAGDGTISRSAILDTAGIRPGINIFALDLKGAHERLMALPRIRHAEILRRLPNRVTIEVETRSPVARIAPAGGDDDHSLVSEFFLADAAGVLFPETGFRQENAYLPIIYGVPDEGLASGRRLESREAVAAIQLVSMLAQTRLGARFQIFSIDLSPVYGMRVRDRHRGIYLLGFEELEGQLERLGVLLDYCDETGREPAHVNLMAQRNVPVMFALPGVAPVESGDSRADDSGGTAPGDADLQDAATPGTDARDASTDETRSVPRVSAPESRSPRPATTPPPQREATPRREPSNTRARGPYNAPLKPFLQTTRSP